MKRLTALSVAVMALALGCGESPTEVETPAVPAAPVVPVGPLLDNASGPKGFGKLSDPGIVSPTNGATISTSSTLLTWTASTVPSQGTEHFILDKYSVTLAKHNGSQFVDLSTTFPSASALSATLSGLCTGTYRVTLRGLAGMTPTQSTHNGLDSHNSQPQSVQFTVSGVSCSPPPANAAPVLGAIGDQETSEGSTLAFTASATDADGNSLTFSLVGAPAGASMGPTTGAFSWTPADGPASATFTIKVTDNGSPALSDEEQITVTVNNVAPTATFGNNGPVNEGQAFSISLASPQDPSTADATAGFQYAFDCGSGTYGSYGTASSTTCPTTTDNGTVAVRGKVKDKDGGETEYTSPQVVVNNVAPTATFTYPTAAVNEGGSFSLSLTNPQDPSSADVAAGFTYAFDCGAGYGATSSNNTISCPAPDGPATPSVKAKIFDKDGGVTEYPAAGTTVSVTINNVAPTATFNYPTASINEGSSFTLSLTSPVDVAADLPGLQYAFDCGSGFGAYGASSSISCPTSDNGTRAVQAKIRDKDGGETIYPLAGSITVTIVNVPPTVAAFTPAPLGPVPVGTSISVNTTFTDPGTGDTHTALVNWDVPGEAPQPVAANGGTVSASRVYNQAGVYTISITVRDDDLGEGSATATQYVVVYDPAAGFVTGGGWINSPAIACPVFCGGAVGKANFGFVAKYQKGASTPVGNTEFEFKAGNLNFKSTSYQWLVVAGARAQYKGVGTINGQGSYNFLLTAIDAQVAGGGPYDAFRIKITDGSGNVLYDNQMGADEDSGDSTALGGGSIVIHSK